jgi:selenocysteine lyase/cysteine desulfurase
MIYADNAATTKISDIAFAKMLPFLQDQYGNASSQYSLGAKAKRAVEYARQQVASAIGAAPDKTRLLPAVQRVTVGCCKALLHLTKAKISTSSHRQWHCH